VGVLGFQKWFDVDRYFGIFLGSATLFGNFPPKIGHFYNILVALSLNLGLYNRFTGNIVESTKVKHLSGGLLACPTSFRLGWKGLPGTSTQAYYEHWA
jgi:hypothetical protein